MKLVHSSHPALRAVAEPVTDADDKEEIRKLVEELFALTTAHNGVGMAAPQAGVSKRVIVVNANGCKQAFINPVITSYTNGYHTAREACLSAPGKSVLVSRAKTVRIEGLDVDGNPLSRRFNGLLARIAQHEVDHLEGKLIG